MEAIFSWVKNIVVFFLVLTLIDEILPDSDYRKYIRLAGGMVLILIVFSPVLKLFGVSDTVDYYYQWESLKTAVAGNSLISDGFDSQSAGERKNDWILSQYEDNLKTQITTLVENEGYGVDSIQVQVDENEAGEDFGKVLALDMQIYKLGGASAPGAAAADGYGINGGENDGGIADSETSGAGGTVTPVETVAPVDIGGAENGDSHGGVTDGVVAESGGTDGSGAVVAGGLPESVGAIASDEILALKKLLSGNYGVHMNQISIHVRGR